MALTLYGISNCDTVRAARRWLENKGVEYRFHDFRVDGLDQSTLENWVHRAGWESVLNRRSTSWRAIAETQRESMDSGTAIQHMHKVPTLIKRPVLEGVLQGKDLLEIGFKAERYQSLLSA